MCIYMYMYMRMNISECSLVCDSKDNIVPHKLRRGVAFAFRRRRLNAVRQHTAHIGLDPVSSTTICTAFLIAFNNQLTITYHSRD